jgi:hypothetical protein
MTRFDHGLPDDGALRAMLHDALVVAPPEAAAARHIDAAVRAGAEATYVVPQTARRRAPKFRSPIMVRAIVVAIVSSLTMTLGLAEADALPKPVQQIVVDVGRFAGVHFPTEKSNAAAPAGDHHALTPRDSVTPRTTVRPDPPVAPTTTTPTHPAAPPAHGGTHTVGVTSPAPTTTPSNPIPKPPVTIPSPGTTPPGPPVVGGPPPPVIGGGNHHPPHKPPRGHHRHLPRRHRPPHHRVRPQS